MKPGGPHTPSSMEQRLGSLSTQVTVIVFWGLVIIGLLFAILLLADRREDLEAQRAAQADSAAYHIGQKLAGDAALSPDRLEHQLRHLLETSGARYLRLERAGRVLAVAGEAEALADGEPQRRGGLGDGQVELLLVFPSLDSVLHEQRRMLLLSLGVLLLLFGMALRNVLERLLTRPLAAMADVAQQKSLGRDDVHFDESAPGEIGYLAGFVNRAFHSLCASEAELLRVKELAEVTLNSIGDAVIRTDQHGRILYLNAVALGLLHSEAGDCRGRQVMEVMRLVDESTGETLVNPMLACVAGDRAACNVGNYRLEREHGEAISLSIAVTPVFEEGVISGAVMVLHDISLTSKLRQELSYQASHDPLTGLYNRAEFLQRLHRARELALRDRCQHTLCYFDLDQFKVVNDTCGHMAGDQLLIHLSELLGQGLRQSDTLARLGGDEFGLLLMQCPPERAIQLAQELRERINDFEFNWKGRSFRIGVSVGLVPITPESADVKGLLSAADIACYAAKEGGRNRIHLYREDDRELSQRREQMGMVAAVRAALEQGRFELFVQPIVSTAEDSALQRYEVLVRMLDEKGEHVPPAQFIPAAERFHLMASLDRWVVEHALAALTELHGRGLALNLSVNLSGQSFNEEGFLDYILDRLRGCDGLAGQLCFEITETAAISHISQARRFIDELRAVGCRFALDDFGSGLSSFAYLKELPVDYLKIDGSFVRDMDHNPDNQAMVKAINEVAKVMGMETIAEFVENERVFDILRGIGVDWGQGYWLGRPEPLSRLLESARSHGASNVIPLG
ncbi:EAL domain-containing protein [Thiohalobacter sp. IOR34]|uniref:EAL domain-containing protein n=1 Tax=Thiohalobacter sp. IOR34 TaxID=3057176 RepID=UPI0025B0748C|nr:EAL domain-containing protein [Thiohalobacter sp. IOR34]WJW74631.1 EAL domain-containing protein [Thiohalobacter sp. IOR34]